MKHFLSSIVVALCLCVGVAHAANDYNLTPEIASAYFEVVENIAENNGNCIMQVGELMGPYGYENVFWDARLVDFNGDKVPELFFIYDPAGDVISHQNRLSETIQYQVWGWNGHDAYQIAKEKPLERVNDSSSPNTLQLKGILYEDGKAYVPFMTQSYGMSDTDIVKLYTLQNGQWVSAPEKLMHAKPNYGANGQRFKNAMIGGKAVTSQQYEQRCNEINNHLIDVWNTGISYIDLNAKYQQFSDQVNVPLMVTSNVDTVQIDRKPVKLQFYNVGDRNYVRLRDLAAAMKNTKKPFDVRWLMNVPRIIPDVPYQGSMQTPVVQTKKAQRDIAFIAVMSEQQYDDLEQLGHMTTEIFAFDAHVLKINDENYVLLRDIAKYVDFSVDWDSATGTVVIDTSR